MTIDQFFVKLKRTRMTWALDQISQIRNAGGYCPVCAVGGWRNRLDYLGAGKRLRLAPQTATRIAHAADAGSDAQVKYRKLRARLLSACGLTEGS